MRPLSFLYKIDFRTTFIEAFFGTMPIFGRVEPVRASCIVSRFKPGLLKSRFNLKS